MRDGVSRGGGGGAEGVGGFGMRLLEGNGGKERKKRGRRWERVFEVNAPHECGRTSLKTVLVLLG